MCYLLRQSYCFIVPCSPLVRIPQRPQRPSSMTAAHHASVVPIKERQGVLLAVVKDYVLRKVYVRSGCRAEEVQRPSQGSMSREEHGSVLGLLRQGEELLAQCVCRLVLRAHVIITPQSTQHGEKLLRIVQVLAEVLSTDVGLFHLKSRVAFGGNQRCP